MVDLNFTFLFNLSVKKSKYFITNFGSIEIVTEIRALGASEIKLMPSVGWAHDERTSSGRPAYNRSVFFFIVICHSHLASLARCDPCSRVLTRSRLHTMRTTSSTITITQWQHMARESRRRCECLLVHVWVRAVVHGTRHTIRVPFFLQVIRLK